MTRKAFVIGICLAALLGFAIRAGHFVFNERDNQLSGDGEFYHRTANLLADGKGYIDPFVYDPSALDQLGLGSSQTGQSHAGIVQPTASHPPMWPLLLSGASRLGLKSVGEQRGVGVLVGTLGVALIGLAGKELFGRRVGVIAAFISAVYGFLWLNDTTVMSESLVTVFVPVITIAAIRWWRSPRWRVAVVLGILSGLGGLLRSELLLYGPLVIVGALLARKVPWRTVVRDGLVVGGVAILVLTPWVARNLTAFEKPIYLSPTGTLLAQTNCDATYYGDKLGYWELFCGAPDPVGPNGELLDESQRDAVQRQRATTYLREHPVRFATVAAPLRVLRMFNIYDPVQTARFDIYVEGRDFRLSMFALAEYYVVCLAAAVGVVVARRRRLPIYVVALWPVLVALVAALGFGNNRYRVSAEPALIWFAALAVYAVFGRLRAMKRSTVSETTQSTATSAS